MRDVSRRRVLASSRVVLAGTMLAGCTGGSEPDEASTPLDGGRTNTQTDRIAESSSPEPSSSEPSTPETTATESSTPFTIEGITPWNYLWQEPDWGESEQKESVDITILDMDIFAKRNSPLHSRPFLEEDLKNIERYDTLDYLERGYFASLTRDLGGVTQAIGLKWSTNIEGELEAIKQRFEANGDQGPYEWGVYEEYKGHTLWQLRNSDGRRASLGHSPSMVGVADSVLIEPRAGRWEPVIKLVIDKIAESDQSMGGMYGNMNTAVKRLPARMLRSVSLRPDFLADVEDEMSPGNYKSIGFSLDLSADVVKETVVSQYTSPEHAEQVASSTDREDRPSGIGLTPSYVLKNTTDKSFNASGVKWTEASVDLSVEDNLLIEKYEYRPSSSGSGG